MRRECQVHRWWKGPNPTAPYESSCACIHRSRLRRMRPRELKPRDLCLPVIREDPPETTRGRPRGEDSLPLTAEIQRFHGPFLESRASTRFRGCCRDLLFRLNFGSSWTSERAIWESVYGHYAHSQALVVAESHRGGTAARRVT